MLFKNSLYLIAALFTTSFSSILYAESSLPTHCKQNEFAYLNALMANKKFFKERDGYRPYARVKNGKVLSICADKENEPLNLITYRYGAIGKVEIEINGTVENQFSIYNQQTTLRTGEDILFFKTGGFTYYVTQATGQGSGIGLKVYKNGKQVVNLISEDPKDFESNLFFINFSDASSPVFVLQEPFDPI